MTDIYDKTDYSTHSTPSESISTHVHLVWDLNFDGKSIMGTAEHTVKIVSPNTKFADFDCGLKVALIGDAIVDGLAQPIILGTESGLGRKISVKIPKPKRTPGASIIVKFFYSIDAEASAVQWLSASATKGKQHPFVFTQCQAIHARTLFPCMDSPGVKATYSAVVTSPKWCTVLMSALLVKSLVIVTDKGEEKNVSEWNQPVPTPAYLVALAAGCLASRDISPRVRVWAEPEVVDAAHFEFSQTEEFLVAAESFTCPYQWGRYDVLCLPPSFPYGGMENPCLTFATPTLLAGDKSLADVIAHEIAHSWTGNLVTNHTWNHFWLNEGWTVWLERKITSKVNGSDEFGKLSAQTGWKHLGDDIKHQGAEGKFTSLVWPLKGDDPDDAFSSVPYEKGFNLLNYLEHLVGTEHFLEFVKAYVQTFKFSTVTTGEFRDLFVEFITQHLTKKQGPAALPLIQRVNELPWDKFFHSTGMPTYLNPDFTNSLSAAAEALAKKCISLIPAGCDRSQMTPSDMAGWKSTQKTIFLDLLLLHEYESELEEVYTDEYLRCMDAAYGFTASKNAEIMFRWQTLCMQNECEWILPHVRDFITSQGRMKFVRPLYRTLRASMMGKHLAIEIFNEYKDTYHPIARKMVFHDLTQAFDHDQAFESTDPDDGSAAESGEVSPLGK